MPKTNLKTLAYNKIRQKIVTCEYAPGTFLNEEILTEALSLSRTPIRDALGRLEQEGLIEIRPKRGIIVKSLTVSDINMIFEVRNMYEPYILKNYGSLLPVERLHGFYDIFLHTDSNSECFKNNDYFYELDSDFHLMIVRSCPNVYIQNNYSLILTQNARFRYMTGNVPITVWRTPSKSIWTSSAPAFRKTGTRLQKKCCITWRNQKNPPSS